MIEVLTLLLFAHRRLDFIGAIIYEGFLFNDSIYFNAVSHLRQFLSDRWAIISTTKQMNA